MPRKPWGPEQDGILLRHYGKMTVAELIAKYLPHRTESAIQSRASDLRLTTHVTHKPWTETENEIVREYYGTIPIQDLATMLPGRTARVIKLHAKSLGLELGQHNTLAWNEYRRLTDGGTHGTILTLLEKKEANRNNSTGVRGVSFDKQKGKYHAYIGFQGRLYNLGHYSTLEEAAKARAEDMAKLRPVLDAVKADIADMKDELIAQAVRTAAEIRQAAKESRGDTSQPTETAP